MVAAMSSISSHMDRVERHSQSAAANLAQARTEAQVYGMERRKRIREHVRAFHEAKETQNGTEDPEMRHTSKVWLDQLPHRETRPRKVPNDERA